MMGTSIAEIRTMATSVTKSGMFGLKNPEQAFTLMLIADAENIAPIQAIQKYSIINGMPSLKSHEIQARFQKSGGKLQWVENTNTKAVCKLTHPSYMDEYLSEFTIEDAKLMGLSNKDNWKRMPKQMLMARAISMGVRAVYPDCLNNMYSVEEAQDIEPVEVIEEVETVEVETEPTMEELKKSLMIQLRKNNYSDSMMKDFYTNFIDSEEVLKEVVSDDTKLNELLNKFEEQ